MKEIINPIKIRQWTEESGIRDIIGIPNPDYRGFVYNKGDMVVVPYQTLSHLLFVVEGSAIVYTLLEDGTHVPVAEIGKGTLLGDMEFYTGESSGNYVEATGRLVCLGLSLSEYHGALDRDVKFLHALLHSFYRKLILADTDFFSENIEDRVIDYMGTLNSAGEMYSVSSALYALHCSRRQLQRVLKKLCDSGQIIRLGKGHYRLNPRAARPE